MAWILLAPLTAMAQPLRGYVQVNYQRTTEAGVSREFWVREIQASQLSRILGSVDMRTQFEFRRLTSPGTPEATTLPRGTLQLAHPLFGLFGSYRPTSETDAVGVRIRQQETLFTGFLTPRGLPRVDGSWLRRRREASGQTPESISLNRTLRVSQDLGPVNLRSGYNDQLQEPRDPRRPRTYQKTFDAGTTVRLEPFERISLVGQYDFNRVNSSLAGGSTGRTRMHAAVVTSSARISTRSNVNLNYSYRRTEIRSTQEQNLNDHDGSLVASFRPTKATQLMTGAGVRTARTAEREDVTRYLLLSAVADGRVRPGWKGQAGIVRSFNWFPGGRSFAVDTYNATSRFHLARGLETTAGLQVTSNGDTAAGNSRVTTQANVGLTATPLRGILVTFSDRRYRAGRSFGTAMARSRSYSIDLRWQPWPALELGGSLTRAGALPRNDPRLTTRLLTLRLTPARTLQFDLSYTRSDQERREAGFGDLAGREIMGARMVAAPWRNWRVSAGLNVADPGRKRESRQADATVTWRFGS